MSSKVKPGGNGGPAGGGGGPCFAVAEKHTIKRLIKKKLFGVNFMCVKVKKKNY
ncbi:hypothetical protein [uncultured Flavobacterium sp.]|uniref:hypothetical protein n=1 Tax=uncultured Flavobacterium sp. TaxID=165435 RepID=UPI0030EDD371